MLILTLLTYHKGYKLTNAHPTRHQWRLVEVSCVGAKWGQGDDSPLLGFKGAEALLRGILRTFCIFVP